MSIPIIECIPNFSEARRPEIVADIRQAIAGVPGAHVLDLHSDLDHNRTVITFAGSPQAVEEAAFRAIARAAQRINLDEHTGEHPRIGATDVVPFVPLSGCTMEDCVALARRLGERVASELAIPVYFYEAAAIRPERTNLESLRRGEYEGLKVAIETDPDRAPDVGPRRLGKAGATVIGARAPLIAYNIYLTTDELGIAKKVAASIRQSSGGLPFVKALGMLVEGRAQVSMNLTNYKETSMTAAFDAIAREASVDGVRILESEIVGLVPADALPTDPARRLKLRSEDLDRVLEKRLESRK